mmetsp:Transcript_34296/g.134505  ORF Transcript_34296/g.134505 Transcript_34296/m.134505 type:complete len:84 (+) Transcript_34296:897-1148(+)
MLFSVQRGSHQIPKQSVKKGVLLRRLCILLVKEEVSPLVGTDVNSYLLALRIRQRFFLRSKQLSSERHFLEKSNSYNNRQNRI